MKVKQVQNCSFSTWYLAFKKITIRSVIIPLSEDFVQYLLADGVVLPNGCEVEYRQSQKSDEDSSDNEVDWDSADSATLEQPSFPELDQKIKEGIQLLGGKVFLKLNWSCPKDAAWISTNSTLCCDCPGDIYILLKSSDFITHDLTQPFEKCEDRESVESSPVKYELVLRKWIDINPGSEFRCFVRENSIVGISQRDNHSFYQHILTERNNIVQDIVSFYNEKIREKFADTSYVFDVQRVCKDKVRLIDFNPWGLTTDSLLFDWEELENLSENQKPDFRYISSEIGVQPYPYRHYAMPADFFHLSTGQDPHKFIDLLNLNRLTMNGPEAPSDEDTS